MSIFAELKRRNSNPRKTGQKLFRVIIGLLVFVSLIMLAERFWISQKDSLAAEQPPVHSTAPEQPASVKFSELITSDKSIAILPFNDRSTGMENTRFFADGIHDDLLTKLAKLNALKVISRTSVMAYRDTTKNMQQIGEELGVTNLLEGGVQQAGNRVRINVQLINVQTDSQLWAESYDREVTTQNIFQIQGEIARAIANALHTTLTLEEDQGLGRAPTGNLEAYRAVLLSRQIERRGNFKALNTAAEYAQQAIDLDPHYVDAYLALAQILTSAIGSGALSDKNTGSRITAALQRAMELQPGYGLTHSILGYYQYISSKPGWADSFETAMHLDPGNTQTMYAYGYSLQRSGRPEPALPLLLQASEQDPLSQPILFALGRNYLVLEDYDNARKAFTRIREIDPSSTLGYGSMSSSFVLQGRLDKALYWLGKAVPVDPKDLEVGGWMVSMNDSLEDYASAQEWSDWLDGWVTKQPQPMAMQARHHYLTGNFELALQLSNRALKMDAPNRWGSDAIFMRIKRDEALANGSPQTGIDVFTTRHPALFESQPRIFAENVMQAVDLAQLMKLADRETDAHRLLDAVIRFHDQPWAVSGATRAWLLPVKAEALAIMGEEAAALTELRRIIDKGWRMNWRWETVLNFNFYGIRETPEFLSMVNELETDMTEQRGRAQAMADRGEIAPPPETGRK
jgi:TolB-like protein/Tfp pilus assembly protein PilF